MSKKVWTEQEISLTLRQIGESMPPLLKKYLIRKVKKTPTMEFVFKKALEDPNFPAEKKEEIRILLESGDFSKEREVENPAIIKKADQYYGRKINEAIKKGLLPPRSEFKNLPWLKKYFS